MNGLPCTVRKMNNLWPRSAHLYKGSNNIVTVQSYQAGWADQQTGRGSGRLVQQES